MTADERGAIFALLDDCDATAARRSSRLYTGFVREWVCHEAAQLDALCESVRVEMQRGLHAVLLADYEFGRQLFLNADALRFLLFDRCEKLSRDEADAWLVQQDGGGAEGGRKEVGGREEKRWGNGGGTGMEKG